MARIILFSHVMTIRHSFPQTEQWVCVPLCHLNPKVLFTRPSFLVTEKLGPRLLSCVRGHRISRCNSSLGCVRGHNFWNKSPPKVVSTDTISTENRDNTRIFLRYHFFSRTMAREQLCYDKE